MTPEKADFVLSVLHLTRRNIQSLMYALPVDHAPTEYKSLASWLNQVDVAIVLTIDK